MKKEPLKKPVGRPKGERKNVPIWMKPSSKLIVREFVKNNEL